MNISNVNIRKTYEDRGRLKALVSITLGEAFAVHDIKIIQGDDRLFVAMPSRKDHNGVFHDITHPITPDARRQIEDSILKAYQVYMQNKITIIQEENGK